MRSIQDLRRAAAAWAEQFDADAISMGDCERVIADITAIEGMLAAAKAEAAARVARSGSWRDAGDQSPAHQLARQTGTTIGAARAVLETGERLRELPPLAEAARRGELSAAQTSAVAAVGAVAPELVAEFVDRAKDTTLTQLRDDAARAIATREPDPRERQRRIYEQRSLRRWVDASGAHVAQLRGTAEMIAGVFTDIAPAREKLFAEARSRGEDMALEALDADALVATVRVGRDGNAPPLLGRQETAKHRCAPRAKMLIRVDFDALLRGYPIDGEVCEIAGYGPVSVDAVRDMAAGGDAFLAAVISKAQQVIGVAHIGRKALAIQQTTLEWLNPICAADGCTEYARLEVDHTNPWVRSKVTLTDLLDRLCSHHHDLKTLKRWGLVPGRGKRPFVPPDDPRHPESTQRTRGDPSAA